MTVSFKFEKRLKSAFQRLCGDGKSVLVALSGGADSTALLYGAVRLAEKCGFKVFASHVNHKIRGAEADRDEKFCRELCEKLGVKLFVVKLDVPKLAKERGESLELCARNVRYAALENFRQKKKIDLIATAHNADDNAETVVHNLIRGTGIDGLAGIPEQRDLIIRPLLGFYRNEIEEYLNELGAEFVNDSTNADTEYTRNFLRHVVLPVMKRVNPATPETVNRLSRFAAEDSRFIAEELKKRENEKLSELPFSLLSRKVNQLYSEKCEGRLSALHTEAICEALYNKKNTVVSLPNGFFAKIRAGKLSFAPEEKLPIIQKTKLSEGENVFCDGLVTVTVSRGEADYKKHKAYVGYKTDKGASTTIAVSLDEEAVKGEIYVRPRKNGDKVLSLGVNKSVKRCFINNKVPVELREAIPVVCDDEGIIYVPFVGATDRVFSKDNGRKINILVCIKERKDNSG